MIHIVRDVLERLYREMAAKLPNFDYMVIRGKTLCVDDHTTQRRIFRLNAVGVNATEPALANYLSEVNTAIAQFVQTHDRYPTHAFLPWRVLPTERVECLLAEPEVYATTVTKILRLEVIYYDGPVKVGLL